MGGVLRELLQPTTSKTGWWADMANIQVYIRERLGLLYINEAALVGAVKEARVLQLLGYYLGVRGLEGQPFFMKWATQPSFPGFTRALHRGHQEPCLGSMTGLHLAASVCASISVLSWACEVL